MPIGCGPGSILIPRLAWWQYLSPCGKRLIAGSPGGTCVIGAGTTTSGTGRTRIGGWE